MTSLHISALPDIELAQEIKKLVSSGEHILIVANKFTVALLHGTTPNGPWLRSCVGELGDTAAKTVKAHVKSNKIWWTSTLEYPATANVSTLQIVYATSSLIKNWMKESDKVTSREGHATTGTKKAVAYLAAYRCQFPGCGKDLGMHAATQKHGTFSYFAHIVAASADGPRGDATLSKLLADDPDNFLLLCDECHRLIDKVDSKKYTVEILHEIRQQSIAEVKLLLDNLKYPAVDAWTILGNVTGQMPQISNRDADEALWNAKLRSSNAQIESYFRNGGQHHNPHEASYWSAVFRTLQYDVPQIQAKLNGIRVEAARPALAVFPLHGTSMLILAGRVLGDMPGTYLFQPHRNKVGGLTETRWTWPAGVAEPAADKYQLRILNEKISDYKEATLLVSLTFRLEPERLAEISFSDGKYNLPALEIYVDLPSSEVIRHPKDLMRLGAVVDNALRILQDDWGIEKVHLYVGAPSTATMTIGQKMQARHQATFVCYEALTGGSNSKFKATIQISSSEVQELFTSRAFSLQT